MKNSEIKIIEWEKIELPYDKIEIWDIIVAKYENSKWADNLPWENYHHAWLISEINWSEVKIIEAPWWNKNWEKKWPVENNLEKSLFNWNNQKLWIIEILLLKPKFPNPIREKWNRDLLSF